MAGVIRIDFHIQSVTSIKHENRPSLHCLAVASNPSGPSIRRKVSGAWAHT
jgi:hypothetical protein